MPASEQTWRDQKLMHVIFGVSSLVMLVATIWMFAKDHNREWREVQLADRGKEKWALNAQLAEANATSHADLMRMERELSIAQSQPLDPAFVDSFKAMVTQEDARLAAEGIAPKSVDLGEFDAAMERIGLAATQAAEARATVEPAQAAAHEAQVAKLKVAAEGADRVALKQAQKDAKAALHALQKADDTRDDAEQQTAKDRENLFAKMGDVIREAKRREDALTVEKKFTAAEHTALVSEQGLAVTNGSPQSEIDAYQSSIDGFAASIEELDASIAAANEYRTGLEGLRRQAKSEAAAIAKQIGTVKTDLNRIADSRDKNTWNAGEWVTRLPILDALYDGNVRIQQLWLPDMLIDYNFSSVARYDRCITCHRSIDKTAPGSAVDPAFANIPDEDREQTLTLATPEEAPADEVAADGSASEPTLESVYGFVLAPRGQIDRYAVTVQYVVPESLAAEAGLAMGDIIREINESHVHSKTDVEQLLLGSLEWGEPASLAISRGLDNPFTSHPRLDLFLGSLSPHQIGDVGCTICHDGQGSATDFKWASHTPDNPNQALEWKKDHGWFDNHHWIFPMMPDRFIESNCLKCHHDVVELEPSERFPEPPAPKLVEGYNLIRSYGCFGCHEVNGFDGPDKRIGPDLRLEPNYHEVAAALLQDEGLSDEERSWASTLVMAPEADQIRNQLMRAIKEDGEDGEVDDGRLSENSHKLAGMLKDTEAPGKLRKAGPSLRYLNSKVDYEWLYSWIRRPADFRPSTKMPQFFGHHEHLESHRKEFTDAEGNADALTDKEFTERFERIEIRALTEFLLANSTDFAYLDQPAEVTEQPSPERGKWLFESRGCLACHSHKEMPGIAANQGPNLSEMAAKFGTGKGQRWLYSWIREPHRYHARTVMPNLFLDPIAETDESGEPTGAVTDPAADILAYLVSVPSDWQPKDVPGRELTPEDEAILQDLTAEWLAGVFPRRRAERYAVEGIPAEQAAGIKGDELALLGMNSSNRTAKQMDYVARRTIGRYGCFGCHDIPGFEGSKPIGTALAEWGRKEPAKLAFENISAFLSTHGIDGTEDPTAHGDEHAEGGGHHGLDPLDFDDDTGYFLQAVNSHQRHGFIWQKLRMPRSFDYSKTLNKRYDERLRMPKFAFTAEEREQVMTFVLGLVNEAPAEKYIYHPDTRGKAIVEGRQVLEKYNCGGCHVLDMETWKFAIDPEWFFEPPVMPEFPALQTNVPEAELEESMATDKRGLIHATIHGMPVYDQETGKPGVVDEDGVPLEPDDDESDPFYEFTLYRDAVVSGSDRLVGVQNLLIPANRDGYGPANGKTYAANGGDLFRYLFPRAIAEEKKSNPQANGSEAWGWLPPPLMDEGEKVQTEWLHGFLMDPHQIRPAAIMRMPNFHMSASDASKLVNYFAAMDDVEWPYEYVDRRRAGYLASLEAAHPGRLEDAMKIVTDGNYCVKCHAVGDFSPKGAIKTQGPQLAEVYQRLRPSYVRDWIANPKRILPYTGMPVNIPFAADSPHLGGVSQDLFPGSSVEQLDGVVDLLMNFDEFAKRQTDIKSMVKEAPPAEGGEEQSADTIEPRDYQSAAK